MLWEYLISNVIIKFSGLSSSDLDLNSHLFVQPTQKLDCGISLLLDLDSNPKLRKNNFEKKGKFFKYASGFYFFKVEKILNIKVKYWFLLVIEPCTYIDTGFNFYKILCLYNI